jgi:hypothetical protein
MNVDLFLSNFAEAVGHHLPALLVMLICCAVAMSCWQRHPPAARWAALGFGWMLISTLLGLAWRTVGIEIAEVPVQSFVEFVSFVFCSISDGLGIIMVLVAFYTALTPHRPPRRHYDED